MKAAVLLLPVLLVGCGRQAELTPPPGAALPPKPATSPVQPTAEQLLTPSPQSRPDRVDDPLHSSTERGTDRFDLPPAG